MVSTVSGGVCPRNLSVKWIFPDFTHLIFAFLLCTVDINISFSATISRGSGTEINVGKIYGKVVDKNSGSPLPAVNVIVEGTTIGARTDADGNFFIINIHPGTYTLKAVNEGFKTVDFSNVIVKVKESTKLDFELESSN